MDESSGRAGRGTHRQPIAAIDAYQQVAGQTVPGSIGLVVAEARVGPDQSQPGPVTGVDQRVVAGRSGGGRARKQRGFGNDLWADDRSDGRVDHQERANHRGY